MRPQISVSLATHKLLSRSPSPIVSSQADPKLAKSSHQIQGPVYLQSSPFHSPNSFLNSPNRTNSAVKQLQNLPSGLENTHEALYIAKEPKTNKTFIVPKEVNERIISLEVENNQLKNEVSLLNGMNQTKERYIKELEEKISTLYSDNRKEEVNCYALKKKEENFSILLKEQKKLFDNNEKILQKEIDDLRTLLSEKGNNNNFDILDKTDNSKEITREFSKNIEIEKTYLESTLKIYKVNIAELETKVLVLNNENNKLTRILNEKLSDNLDMSRELESKLKQEFECQRTEVEVKLSKILEENKKVVTFNNSLLAELEHYKGINDSLQRKHENHIEELKNSWKGQTEKKMEDLKSKSLSERKNLENQLTNAKGFSNDLERRYHECLEENNRVRGLLLEKENLLSECKEKLVYTQNKISQEEELEKALLENHKQIGELQDKTNTLTLENRKMREVIENNNKELELWKEKYISSNEIHAKVVEDLKFQLENRRSALLEAEVKQRTLGLESECSNLKTKVLISEAEKKSFEEKNELLNEESRKFEQIIYDRMEEIVKLKEEMKGFKQKEEDILTKQTLLSQKDEKISHLEDSICTLLSENNKLNQMMKTSINERELLIVKFEAFKQDNISKIEELKLKHSKELSQEIKKEVEQFKHTMSEAETKNLGLIKEVEQLNLIQASLNQTLSNYSNILVGKEQEIILLRDEVIKEREKNEQNRNETEKIEKERNELKEKIENIDENHKSQMKEIKNKAVEMTLERKKKLEAEFNKEVSLHKDCLKMAKDRLLECHRVLLSIQSGKAPDNQAGAELQKNLEEAEKTLFYLKDMLNERETMNPCQRNNEDFLTLLEESRNPGGKPNEIVNKMREIEHEHEVCYEDLRGEFDLQARNHAMSYGKLREEYDFFRQKCSNEHLQVIASLENQLQLKDMEREQMKGELLSQIERIRGEMHVAVQNLERNNHELRFGWEKECENLVMRETFTLRAENNELKREIFEIENEARHFRRELQILEVENIHLKKSITVLNQKNTMNTESMRNILSNIENRQDSKKEAFKVNEVLKPRKNELENLNRSFESIRNGKGKEYMRNDETNKNFGKPLSVLSENERLNAQILKRCREILN